MTRVIVGKPRGTFSGDVKIMLTDTERRVFVAILRHQHRQLGHYIYTVHPGSTHEPENITVLQDVLEKAKEVLEKWKAGELDSL